MQRGNARHSLAPLEKHCKQAQVASLEPLLLSLMSQSQVSHIQFQLTFDHLHLHRSAVDGLTS